MKELYQEFDEMIDEIVDRDESGKRPISMRADDDEIALSVRAKQWKDQLPGGLADKKKPEDFDQKQLEKGIKIEMEHVNDRKLAMEIAMDHLTEDPQYYNKLKTIENR